MRNIIRVDGRGVSVGIVDISDRIGVETKTAPESVATDPGPDPESPIREVGAMANRSNRPLTAHQQIALDFLGFARDDMERATRTRIRYVSLARGYGLTNAAIGEALGVTEGAIRGLIERHGDLEHIYGDSEWGDE